MNLSIVNSGSQPHRACVNDGPWREFRSKAAALRWVYRQCKTERDMGWVHPATAFDDDGNFIGEGRARERGAQ